MGGSSTASGSHRHGQIWGAPSTRAAAPTLVQFAVSERANFNLTKLVYEEWIGVERLVRLDGYCAYNYQWATGAKSRGAGAVTRGLRSRLNLPFLSERTCILPNFCADNALE